MKKIILILSGLMMLYLTSTGQEYFPTVVEGNSWDVMITNQYMPFDSSWFTTTYVMTGDTTINALVYKKMYYTDTYGTHYQSCMREDANRKVWQNDYGTPNEILMYDYTLHAGDSILLGNLEPMSMYMHVDSVTSIIIDGNARQRFWLSVGDENYTAYENWIEGIGSNRGILTSGSEYFVGGHNWLLCMSQNSELLYMNPYYNYCSLYSAIEQLKDPVLTLFPNPAKGRVNIVDYGMLTGDVTVIIYDNKGVEVMRTKFSESRDSGIDVSSLPPGLYFVKIKSDKETQTIKLVML
jgi:hypothetical protein